MSTGQYSHFISVSLSHREKARAGGVIKRGTKRVGGETEGVREGRKERARRGGNE